MTVRPGVRDEPLDTAALREHPAARVSLAAVVVVLLRNWRALLGVPIAVTCITTVVVLVVTPRYESVFTLVPASSTQGQLTQLGNLPVGGGLAAIAQGLGFGSILGTGAPLEYFSDLAKSRRVAERVLTRQLPPGVAGADSSVHTLLDVYGMDTGDPRKDMDLAYRLYQDHMLEVTTDPQSGILTATVSARSPDLALTVGHIILNELSKANLEIRQEYANQQVAFIRSQAEQAQRALVSAEDSLMGFYVANRTYESSPALVFAEGRLKRRVDLAQTVYVGLAQQLEQARITAAQNTPAFSVIDAPAVPGLRRFPKRVLSVILSAIGAACVIAGIVLFRSFYMNDPDEQLRASAAMTDAARVTLRDLRDTYKRLVRRKS